MQPSIVFLDLEQTVIQSWEDQTFLTENLFKIKAGLNPEDKLGLMSWAVWDDRDKAVFNQRIRPTLEEFFEKEFTDELVLSMTDISDIILKKKKKWVSRDDMFDLFSKEECLLSLLRFNWFDPISSVILIDDAVDHGLCFSVNDTMVVFINIDEI